MAEAAHLRVHYGMAGSAPLVLYDVVFERRGVYVVHAGSFSPLFGVGRGRHRRRAAELDAVYDELGVDGLLAAAERVVWVSYDALDVVLYDGGWLTRPKLVLAGDRELSMRLHDVDVDSLLPRLRSFLADRGVGVDARRGAGLF